MATVIKTLPFHRPPLPSTCTTTTIPVKSPKPFSVSFRQQHRRSTSRLCSLTTSLRFGASNHHPSLRFVRFSPLASTGETETTETEEEVQEPQVEIEQILGWKSAIHYSSFMNESSDDAVGVADGAIDDDGSTNEAVEARTSVIIELLQSYKEALANNDDSRVAEIEAFLKSIEEERVDLESQVTILSEELTIERDRILRISADFDNFRKRTERERLSLVTNAQGEVVERLLQVLDNFERAKTQIKVETEGEEKINNSYQSIYKQLVEILGSFGVVAVETVGKPFDPLLHEAIMREESEEFDEGVIIEEFRKGFKLGDRLLRPSMVKVSAGPGPAKPEEVKPEEDGADVGEITENSPAEVEAESS